MQAAWVRPPVRHVYMVVPTEVPVLLVTSDRMGTRVSPCPHPPSGAPRLCRGCRGSRGPERPRHPTPSGRMGTGAHWGLSDSRTCLSVPRLIALPSLGVPSLTPDPLLAWPSLCLLFTACLPWTWGSVSCILPSRWGLLESSAFCSQMSERRSPLIPLLHSPSDPMTPMARQRALTRTVPCWPRASTPSL